MQTQKRIMLKKKRTQLLTEKTTSNITNEGDFLSVITKKLKNSKQCQLCNSFKIVERNNLVCNNFEAMWYHRDTNFALFDNCSHFQTKIKS